jgi:hypothetical protein
MSDRVPICTIPGLVSQLVDVDVMIAPADVAKLITRVFLSRTDHEAGDVVTAAVRNATAGGGEGISVTLASGENEQTETGSVTVEADEPTYLRVTAADAHSMNLRGWFEVDGAAGVTAALTTLARVKQFIELSGSDDDDLINNLIASVSSEIQGWLDRAIVQATATDEKIDSIGDNVISTRFYPIISISALTENGTALVEDTDFEIEEQDKERGQIARISGGYASSWASGTRIVKVTYSHGYASIPDAIIQAANELVAYDYRQSKPGGYRFGKLNKVLDTGGTSNYLSRDDLWKAQMRRLAGYRRMAF